MCLCELLVKRKIAQPETHVLVLTDLSDRCRYLTGGRKLKEQDLYRMDLNITSNILKIYLPWVFHARVYFKFILHVINSR